MTWTKQWWLPWAVFTTAGSLIVYPWFVKPGFLFLLDFVWTPQLALPLSPNETGHISSLPWQWLWWALAQVLETSVVQKIAFALPWLLAGIAMYQLTSWLLTQQTKAPELLITLAALSAGMFYLTNSFVFARAVMGQYYLLLAYALTPWALLAWLRFLSQPAIKQGLIAGLVTTMVMLTNAHHLILLPLLLLFFIRRPQRGKSQAWLVFLAPIVALVVTTLVAGRATPVNATLFDALGPWARALQAPNSGNLLLDTITLTATWKVDLPYMFPYESLPGFTATAIVLLAMMLVGAIYFWRQKTIASLIKRLLIMIAVSVTLAIGVAHPTIEPIAAWLYRFVPGWIGLRDSAKFLSLLAVGEAILLGLGIVACATLAQRLPWRRAATTTAIAALLLTIYAATPAKSGFSQQIYPLIYPASWYEWNEAMTIASRPARTLFLPWHQYLPFAFTADRTVANPAPDFFTNSEIISGDNSEVGGSRSRPFIYSESKQPQSARLENILADAPTRVDLANRLAEEKIEYVILATDTLDADKYYYLYQQPNLQPAFQSPDLVVWKNTALLK